MGMIQTYPTLSAPASTKRTVTTVTEYDKEGRVVKVTTTEETLDTPSRPQYTWNEQFYVTNMAERSAQSSHI
jgi:hypothetical protein